MNNGKRKKKKMPVVIELLYIIQWSLNNGRELRNGRQAFSLNKKNIFHFKIRGLKIPIKRLLVVSSLRTF